MSDHPCCRINRGKIHGGDIKGTKNNMLDHLCCRINRGRINRVPMYTVKAIISLNPVSPPEPVFYSEIIFFHFTALFPPQIISKKIKYFLRFCPQNDLSILFQKF